MILDHLDYVTEVNKQLSDKTISKDDTFNKNIIQNLTERNNKILENLKRRGLITEKQLKCFRFDFKTSCNLTKLDFLHKVLKRLLNVSMKHVISNCGKTAEKVSKFLGNQLQPFMTKGLS